jgi:hypothetical protein
MRKEHQNLIEKLVQSLDWNTIFEIHKTFKFGVGVGSEIIPGLKRKVFSESLTKTDLKNELRSLIKFVIENDHPKLIYGQWMIFWFNQEWDIDISMEKYVDFEEEDDLEDYVFDSRIEVFYAPQRIAITTNLEFSEETKKESEFSPIETMLEKAISAENYELASKLREVLKYKNPNQNLDK